MRIFEVLALTNGYFQVMHNTLDGRYWVPVGREFPTLETAQADANTREAQAAALERSLEEETL